MTNLKEDIYKIYKKTKKVKSKVLKDYVVFNRYGWIHLSFTSGGHRRPTKDRRLRLNLFPFVNEVIKNANLIIKETEGVVFSKQGLKGK